jgi:sulfate adenylyltransferase subunit 2
VTYRIDHLRELEEEAVYIMREAVAQLTRPVLLFSGGKDSAVLLRIAEKAFRPSKLPFPIMHIDTGHNFSEALDFRDRRIAQLGERLIVRKVQDSIDAGRVREETGPRATRNRLQTVTLLDAIREFSFDCIFGGARRDEERARAKERVFSFRDRFGQWDPKEQRPEVWDLYDASVRPGEQMRVFPLSNWTEIDVWRYVEREEMELPSIYFSHVRRVFEDGAMLVPESPYVSFPGAVAVEARVRFRTVGDMTCTAAIRSDARDIASVITELEATRISERGQSRVDDTYSEAAMEDRKRVGYF